MAGMTDEQFCKFLRSHFDSAMSAREATFNNAVYNRINDMEKKLEAYNKVMAYIEDKEIALMGVTNIDKYPNMKAELKMIKEIKKLVEEN